MMQGREEAAEPGGGCRILARRMWGEEGHSTPRHACGSGQSERQGGDTGWGGACRPGVWRAGATVRLRPSHTLPTNPKHPPLT